MNRACFTNANLHENKPKRAASGHFKTNYLRMKTIFLSIFIVYCLTDVIYSQSGNVKGPYFGQTPPGDTPRLFVMPAIASQSNFLTTRIAFSPDGKECFFSGYNDWSTNNSQLYYTKCIDNVWTSPVAAPFFQPPGSMCSHPFFSSDGNRLYFSKNADIWVVDRTTNGWGNPKVLPAPINTSSYEGTYSQTTGGIAYVESWRPGGKGGDDIWQVSGLTQEAVNLGPAVNSGADDGTEFISSDGRYLLFFSTRTGGREDLYVTFRKANGSWTVAVNLNQFIPGINTVNTEYAPKISPDGHYLFYTYLDHDAQKGGIYWVSAKNIDSLRNFYFPPYLNHLIPDQFSQKNSSFNYQIPDSTFIDDNGNNTLIYSATLSDGKPLPSGINFNVETKTFSGTPDSAGTFLIKITVIDAAKASASTQFTLTR